MKKILVVDDEKPLADILRINLEKENYDIRVENTSLKEENEILRQKIDALLTFIKDHKE